MLGRCTWTDQMCLSIIFEYIRVFPSFSSMIVSHFFLGEFLQAESHGTGRVLSPKMN